MIDSLYDDSTQVQFITRKDIINSLTIDDIQRFLQSLGVTQIAVYPEKGYLICPTICHNPINEEASMKLYWYQNNKIFRCYTECNEAMSIFTLYKKFIILNEHREPSEFEINDYIGRIIKHIVHIDYVTTVNTFDPNKYTFTTNIPQLPEYPQSVLDCFIHYHHPSWLYDGITVQSMDKFKIGFSVGQNKITIPHFDINGRLVGIRARTLDEQEAQTSGKYKPIQLGEVIYSHPLQFNLYGLYEHQIGIQHRRSAIIAEGEKSVLLDDGYYGDLSNTVACCGSSFNKYHVSLLTHFAGATEIVVAFDKEYQTCNSEKAQEYRRKIEKLCKKYSSYATFSYIWDFDNVLEEKDSPFDRGKDIFEHLYKTRIKVKG